MSRLRAAWTVTAAVVLGAAGLPADPDWPCVQRLVPELAAGAYWGGPVASGDWHADPRVAAVVASVAPRGVAAQAGADQLSAFADTLPAPERPAVLAEVFAGLVEDINTQRTEIIDRLHSIAHRQRLLAETTSRITGELRALPADAPAAQREEIVSRRALLIREFQEIERTIRYACEAPVQMEAKLGTLAQALQGKLGG